MNSDLKLGQIQNKLNKHCFLAKGSAPGHADAFVFKKISNAKKVPDRQSYPNLYHWFILMKQFSPTVINKWFADGNTSDEELTVEFIGNKQINCTKTNIEGANILYTSQQMSEKCNSFIMELKIQPKQIAQVVKKLKNFFEKQLSYIERLSNSEIKACFKSEIMENQKIKQVVSQWNEINRIQIRKVKRENSRDLQQTI